MALQIGKLYVAARRRTPEGKLVCFRVATYAGRSGIPAGESFVLLEVLQPDWRYRVLKADGTVDTFGGVPETALFLVTEEDG